MQSLNPDSIRQEPLSGDRQETTPSSFSSSDTPSASCTVLRPNLPSIPVFPIGYFYVLPIGVRDSRDESSLHGALASLPSALSSDRAVSFVLSFYDALRRFDGGSYFNTWPESNDGDAIEGVAWRIPPLDSGSTGKTGVFFFVNPLPNEVRQKEIVLWIEYKLPSSIQLVSEQANEEQGTKSQAAHRANWSRWRRSRRRWRQISR